jgi:hypothetical protein
MFAAVFSDRPTWRPLPGGFPPAPLLPERNNPPPGSGPGHANAPNEPMPVPTDSFAPDGRIQIAVANKNQHSRKNLDSGVDFARFMSTIHP